MKFYSEKLNKLFDSTESLEAEEKSVAEKKAQEEKRQERLKSERKARAKEIEDKQAELQKLMNSFLQDYGTYHFNISFGSPFSIFDTIFRF